jgi:hypothetical protein
MKKKDWEFLAQYGITKDNLTVGGDLDLEGTSVSVLPDNLTVGGYLYLEGTSVSVLPDNLTVGGSLDLRGTSVSVLPDNLTVGGYLDLRGTQIKDSSNINRKCPYVLSWRNGKYIKVDGVFCEVLHKKGLVWKVKKYATEKVFFVVTDGNGNYSHGDTIKEAKEDLIFKIGNRSKDDYKGMTLESVLSFEDAVKCYRVITGACQFGVKEFLSRKNLTKRKMNIAKIIELTKGEYGSQQFEQFFN